MTDDRLDLSPLDPASDPERWARFVDRVAADAARGVATRAPAARASTGIAAELARWARPSLAAAAVLVMAAAASLAGGARQRPAPRPALGVALLSVPAPVGQWMSATRAPGAADVYAGLARSASP